MNAIDYIFAGAFGEAGLSIIIEDFLIGEEASFIVACDGKHVLALTTSQDHKTRDDGDKGPNTGGMGAYSPAPVITDAIEKRIMEEIIYPVIQGMAKEGAPYSGFLYAGIMIDPQGKPWVLEFNCRLGDPETQPLMLRLRSDLISLCQAILNQKLNTIDIQWDPRPALGVVLASGGYPNKYNTYCLITGLSQETDPDTKIFHAGTVLKNNQVLTAGGRVLCVTALGKDILGAQTNAYKLTKQIHWDNMQYRTDIGYRAIKNKT